MVPVASTVQENIYHLRDYVHRKAEESTTDNPFKSCFFSLLGLTDSKITIAYDSLSLYQKCAISGLQLIEECVPETDLLRLLGQSSQIDSTPMPWVADPIGVMSIMWLVDIYQGEATNASFRSWLDDFLPKQTTSSRLNVFEQDITQYVANPDSPKFLTATIPLFFHYHSKLPITDQKIRHDLVAKFMKEFQEHAPKISDSALLSIIVFVFDHVNRNIALAPPNSWSLENLVVFLENIPAGLKRWTWENEKRTKNSLPVKWAVENEYHVQNLLYTLLAPIFEDIVDEMYLQSVGQKTPRADLYLPSIDSIIEVKYRKDSKKSFQSLISEIAEDTSLYRADTNYKDAYIVCFLWDHTRATQEHAKFKQGIEQMHDKNSCVVISSPSVMH